MQSKGAEGLPAETQESVVAANEEFEDSGEHDPAVSAHAGWDPYDVWRTRVKGAVPKEHEADPRR